MAYFPFVQAARSRFLHYNIAVSGRKTLTNTKIRQRGTGGDGAESGKSFGINVFLV
jgi:hypothetical protein